MLPPSRYLLSAEYYVPIAKPGTVARESLIKRFPLCSLSTFAICCLLPLLDILLLFVSNSLLVLEALPTTCMHSVRGRILWTF